MLIPVITQSFVSLEFVSSCCLICPGIFFPFLHTECLLSFLLSNESVFIFYPPVPTWSLCSQIRILLYETLDNTSLTLTIFTVLYFIVFSWMHIISSWVYCKFSEDGIVPCLLDISNHIIDIGIGKYIRKHYTKVCRTLNMLFRGLLRSCVVSLYRVIYNSNKAGRGLAYTVHLIKNG